jgi:hypothetical protein
MSRADVVSIAAAAWQRLGLRDALASAGFVALRAAIVAAHNISSAEAP